MNFFFKKCRENKILYSPSKTKSSHSQGGNENKGQSKTKIPIVIYFMRYS